MSMPDNPPKKKTAFVLSGGGSLGAVQVGMIKALFEHGIAPDFYVGTSVGAINSAFLCGNPGMEGVLSLEKIWISLRRKDIFPVSPFAGIMRLFRRRNYLVSPKGLRRVLERNLNYETLGDASVPCVLIATDLLTGEQVTLSSGNAVNAVMASTAIPGVYPPVEIAGRFLVDGGVSSNTPLSVAAQYGAEEVYILPAGYPCTLRTLPAGLVDIFLHSLSILISQQLLHDIELYRGKIELHIIPPLCPVSIMLHDLSNTAEFISRAHYNAKKWLESGGMKTFKIPHRMTPHNHWI